MCSSDENALHDLLGITDLRLKLRRVIAHQTEQEHQMANVLEALAALAEQQNATSAAQQAAFTNLQAAIDRLEEAVRTGEVSAEVQSAVDELSAGFTALTDAATRADDGYEPAPTEPTPGEPTEPTPAEPGTGTEPGEPGTTTAR